MTTPEIEKVARMQCNPILISLTAEERIKRFAFSLLSPTTCSEVEKPRLLAPRQGLIR